MNLDALLDFIALEDKRLNESYAACHDQEKRVLARTVKLSEEVGELCDAVLTCCAMQRGDKLERRESGDVPGEVADVLITTLLLARAMEVDILAALQNKIAAINERYESQ